MRTGKRLPALGATAAGAALVASLLAAPPAGAATAGPVVDGLSLSSSTVAAGGSVTLTATATNTTSQTLDVSLGVEVPSGISATRPAVRNCGPYGRDIGWLVYCGGTVAPGGQAVLTFTVTPSATGTYTLKSYARQTYTTDDTWSSVTLTAG